MTDLKCDHKEYEFVENQTSKHISENPIMNFPPICPYCETPIKNQLTGLYHCGYSVREGRTELCEARGELEQLKTRLAQLERLVVVDYRNYLGKWSVWVDLPEGGIKPEIGATLGKVVP